jgi:hypothetical protein
MTHNILNQLAALETRIADCRVQLEDNAQTGQRSHDWESRCRYALRSYEAKRDALLRVLEAAQKYTTAWSSLSQIIN